ncbi:substrate-binding domain-containing protein [Streptomyces sp. NPDC047082]|uniref:substrate-binding domain-containing protein n=1 Tax=Streptomyces sp. NPDC047082 TaxID=3155259 RepID=UPI0033F2EB84
MPAGIPTVEVGHRRCLGRRADHGAGQACRPKPGAPLPRRVPLQEQRCRRIRDVTDAATMAAQPDRFRVDVLNVQHRAEPHTAGVLNDFAAIRAMGAARDLGLALGRDLAPAGFNDTPLASQLPVPLTSVHSPTAELRRRAVNLLVHRIAGEDIRSEVLMPRLMARECTGGAVGRLCRDRQTRA